MSLKTNLNFILKFLKIVTFIMGILSWVLISFSVASILLSDPANIREFESYEDIDKEGTVGDITWFPNFFPKTSKEITLWTNVESNDYKITFTLQDEQELADLLKGASVTTSSQRRKGYDAKEYSFWCKTDHEYDRRTHLIITNNLKPEIVIRNPYTDECRCNTL